MCIIVNMRIIIIVHLCFEAVLLHLKRVTEISSVSLFIAFDAGLFI